MCIFRYFVLRPTCSYTEQKKIFVSEKNKHYIFLPILIVYTEKHIYKYLKQIHNWQFLGEFVTRACAAIATHSVINNRIQN